MRYDFTSKTDFMNWANDVRPDTCMASVKDFVAGLTENTRLSHIMQWLFRDCQFRKLIDKVEKYTHSHVETFNTYNWNGNGTNILQGFNFDYNGTPYFGLQIHLGGDARCNYSDVVVFEGNFFTETEDFYPTPLEFEVDGVKYSATPSLTTEVVTVDSENGECWECCACDKDDLIEAVRTKLALLSGKEPK